MSDPDAFETMPMSANPDSVEREEAAVFLAAALRATETSREHWARLQALLPRQERSAGAG